MEVEAKFYTSDDMRKLFKLTRRQLKYWIAKGKLPKPVLEGRWLKCTIDAFIAELLGTQSDNNDHLGQTN